MKGMLILSIAFSVLFTPVTSYGFERYSSEFSAKKADEQKAIVEILRKLLHEYVASRDSFIEFKLLESLTDLNAIAIQTRTMADVEKAMCPKCESASQAAREGIAATGLACGCMVLVADNFVKTSSERSLEQARRLYWDVVTGCSRYGLDEEVKAAEAGLEKVRGKK